MGGDGRDPPNPSGEEDTTSTDDASAPFIDYKGGDGRDPPNPSGDEETNPPNPSGDEEATSTDDASAPIIDYMGGDGRDPPNPSGEEETTSTDDASAVATTTTHEHAESCGKGCSKTVYDDDTTYHVDSYDTFLFRRNFVAAEKNMGVHADQDTNTDTDPVHWAVWSTNGDGAGNVVENSADELAVGNPDTQVAGSLGSDSNVGSLGGQTSRKSGSGAGTSHSSSWVESDTTDSDTTGLGAMEESEQEIGGTSGLAPGKTTSVADDDDGSNTETNTDTRRWSVWTTNGNGYGDVDSTGTTSSKSKGAKAAKAGGLRLAKVNAPDARLPDGAVQASPDVPAPLTPTNMAKVNAPDARLPDGAVHASPDVPAPLVPSMSLAAETSDKTFTTNRSTERSPSVMIMGAAALAVVGAVLVTYRTVRRRGSAGAFHVEVYTPI